MKGHPKFVMSPKCPCCNENLSEYDESLQERISHCKICYGILASEDWLGANLEKKEFLSLYKAVFDGKPVNFKCPECRGDMIGGLVSPGSNVYEVEGCIDCHSIWFDCRELDLFANKIVSFGDDESEVLPVPEDSGGAGGEGGEDADSDADSDSIIVDFLGSAVLEAIIILPLAFIFG